MVAGKDFAQNDIFVNCIIIYLICIVNKSVDVEGRVELRYEIYFDESNKLDQPNGNYSYYGALGSSKSTIESVIEKINNINSVLATKSELHFVDYTSDTHFEKYFKVLDFVVQQDIKINILIVNKKDAKGISEAMEISLTDLRELFYVKIPERLFYGMTRTLKDGELVRITIDENSEYEKIELEKKIEEQMNAHSAYRNKGYKVDDVKQISSERNIPLQLIDVFMGIVIFLLEHQYNGKLSINKIVKSDLIYRFLIQNDNLDNLQKKVRLYKWEGSEEKIKEFNLGECIGEFLVYKTQFDIKEMTRLAEIKLNNPSAETKFYREKMGYGTRQLRTIQGYLAELNGEGRNEFYLKSE